MFYVSTCSYESVRDLLTQSIIEILINVCISRKRRLLQVDRESPPSPRPTRPVSISEPVNAPDERRIPKLEPLTPLKGEQSSREMKSNSF